MATYEIADLMEKVRDSMDAEVTHTKEGQTWTLMERGVPLDAGRTMWVFTNGETEIRRSDISKLQEVVKETLQIDIINDVPSLENWIGKPKKPDTDRPPPAQIYDKIIASKTRAITCTTEGRTWEISLEGTPFDASYQTFVFNNGRQTIRDRRIGKLHELVKERFKIDFLTVSIQEWEDKK